MPQPLYPQGKETWYPLKSSWVGPRSMLKDGQEYVIYHEKTFPHHDIQNQT